MDYQQTTIEGLGLQMAQLQQSLVDLQAKLDALIGEKSLIFGRFRRGELIKMKDKRLYEGQGAPFESYNAVWNAKKRGCPFFTPAGMRVWQITADDLEYWLRNSDCKNQVNIIKLV